MILGRVKRQTETERYKSAQKGLYKKNTSPKPLTGKTGRADYCKFLQATEWKSEVLEVCAITMVESNRCRDAPMGEEG